MYVYGLLDFVDVFQTANSRIEFSSVPKQFPVKSENQYSLVTKTILEVKNKFGFTCSKCQFKKGFVVLIVTYYAFYVYC